MKNGRYTDVCAISRVVFYVISRLAQSWQISFHFRQVSLHRMQKQKNFADINTVTKGSTAWTLDKGAAAVLTDRRTAEEERRKRRKDGNGSNRQCRLPMGRRFSKQAHIFDVGKRDAGIL